MKRECNTEHGLEANQGEGEDESKEEWEMKMTEKACRIRER